MAIITTFKCSRCLANGTVDNTGTYLKVFLAYTSSVSSTYTIKYAKDGTTTYTTFKTGTATSLNTSFVSSSPILEADYSYSISLEIDGGASGGWNGKIDFIPKSFVLLDFNASGKGIAIGKISEKSNAVEFGMDMYDKHGARILNGLTYYLSNGGIDPDTTTEELVLTTTNTPISGTFFYIRTMFYSSKSASSNRTQIAYPYNSDKSTYYRYYVNGSGWTSWKEQPVILSSGTSGIWTYRTYSDGTAECFGKINCSQIAVNATLGNWHRSEALYEATAYPYPVAFSEAPSTEIMFQTRNSSAALIWPFSSSAENAKAYLPQCYLIRPVTAESCNGNINIIAKGKI